MFSIFKKPSLVTRVVTGKTVGFLFGLIPFIFLPHFLPDVSWLTRWGILLWYNTLGGLIGIFGVIDHHPVLKFPIPWWLRASLLGGWMNFVLIFFAYDTIRAGLISVLGENGSINSPFWFVLEGCVIGLIMGYLATRLGGEGKEILKETQSK